MKIKPNLQFEVQRLSAGNLLGLETKNNVSRDNKFGLILELHNILNRTAFSDHPKLSENYPTNCFYSYLSKEPKLNKKRNPIYKLL